MEVQVDVEVGVEEGVEEEEVVVEVVQVVTSPSWPSSWARGEGGWRRWRGRWTGVATPFLLLEVLLDTPTVVREEVELVRVRLKVGVTRWYWVLGMGPSTTPALVSSLPRMLP